MNLDGFFRNAEVGGDLLVQQPAGDQDKYLALARRQRIVALGEGQQGQFGINHSLSLHHSPERARQYRDIRKAVTDPRFQNEVEHDESLNFLLRDTISLTMMGGSEQTNVIPPEAWANLDVRILPGGDPKALLDALRRVVNDPNVIIEPLNAEFRVANYSPTDTTLFAAIRLVSGKYFPGTPVVPHITSGYTENQRYRPLGIHSYGFNPYAATEEEGSTEHGNDERIRIEEVRRGPQILFDVVAAVAGEK